MIDPDALHAMLIDEEHTLAVAMRLYAQKMNLYRAAKRGGRSAMITRELATLDLAARDLSHVMQEVLDG